MKRMLAVAVVGIVLAAAWLAWVAASGRQAPGQAAPPAPTPAVAAAPAPAVEPADPPASPGPEAQAPAPAAAPAAPQVTEATPPPAPAASRPPAAATAARSRSTPPPGRAPQAASEPMRLTQPPPAEAAAPATAAAAPGSALSGAVAGTLRDAAGRPIPGAAVLAVSADGADAGETITDDDGFFLVAALRPGPYEVFAGLETALAARIGARRAVVGAGSVARLDLREPAAGATVRVRAVDSEGADAGAVQAILVAGPPSGPGSLASVLEGDAIWLPAMDQPRLVLPRVPPGVYTLVVLRGGDAAPVAARDPVKVGGDDRVLAVQVRVPRS